MVMDNQNEKITYFQIPGEKKTLNYFILEILNFTFALY